MPFILGVCTLDQTIKHLLQEQQPCLIYDDETIFNNDWKDKKITARIYLDSKKLLLDSWAKRYNFTLPMAYHELHCSVQELSKKTFYSFDFHGLCENILQDPAGNNIVISKKESQFLAYLMEHNQTTKDDLLSKVWKYDTSLSTHTLESHVYSLRRKIAAFSSAPFEIALCNSFYTLKTKADLEN